MSDPAFRRRVAGCAGEPSPDPILSANIYCAGRLDEVICGLVAPFWRDVWQTAAQPPGYLWFLRYSRGGEHLKLRIHGSGVTSPWIRRRLTEAASAYLSTAELAAGPSGAPQKNVPPIDVEDRGREAREDRSLVWTQYRRSPVSLGSDPLLADDEYVALFTRCLGAAAELILETLRPDGGRVAHSLRQSILLRLAAAAVSALWPARADQVRYLEYHRDWAVRFPVLRAGGRREKAEDILARYERESAQMASRHGEALRRTLESGETSGLFKEGLGDLVGDWQRALRELGGHLDRFEGDDAYDLDPFAEGPLLPSALKVLNGVANQVGLNPLNEGLAFHLLLRILQKDGPSRRFVLVPAGEAEPLSSAPTTSEKTPFNFEDDYRWLELVSAFGPEAHHWVEEYWRESAERLPGIQRAVALMRDQQLEQGYALLSEVGASRRPLRRSLPSIYHALGRFYYAGWAYYYYCLEDFDRAERLIDRVGVSIRGAVERERFLLPFAVLLTDVPLKRAQICRARRRWRQMESFVREADELIGDRRPLCVLRDGLAVYHSTIGRLLESAPHFGAEHAVGAQYLLDGALRGQVHGRMVGALYLMPGGLIPYP